MTNPGLTGYDKRGRNTKGNNMFNHLNQNQQLANGYPKTQQQAIFHHQRNKTHMIPGSMMQNQAMYRQINPGENVPANGGSLNNRMSLQMGSKQTPHTQKISSKVSGKHSKQALYVGVNNFNNSQQMAMRVQSGHTRKSNQGNNSVYLKTDGSQGSQGQQSMNQ